MHSNKVTISRDVKFVDNVFPFAPNKYKTQGHHEDKFNDEFTLDREDDELESFELPLKVE